MNSLNIPTLFRRKIYVVKNGGDLHCTLKMLKLKLYLITAQKND